jgi:hypothetical protein
VGNTFAKPNCSNGESHNQLPDRSFFWKSCLFDQTFTKKTSISCTVKQYSGVRNLGFPPAGIPS